MKPATSHWTGLFAALVTVGGPSSALAQSPGAPPSAPSLAASSPAPPGRPASASSDPFVPVDDAMLVPPPPAAHVIQSWKQALDLVRTRSPDLRSAYAQIEVARGRARMTLAGALPKLTASANLSHQLIVPQPVGNATDNFFPDTVFTGRADLVVPLISVRNWYDYATAKTYVDKTDFDAADVERRIIAGLAEALVGVVTAERLAEVTRSNLASALSMLELNRKRESLGGSSSIDVLRAEQEVATSRAAVIQADEALRRARESLGQALGYEEGWGIAPEVKLDSLQKDARRSCEPNQKLEDRADMRSLRVAERVADRNVTSASLALVPTLNAQSSVVASTNDYATGSLGPVAWSISGLLSWNLYDGGQRYGERRQNEGLLEVAHQASLGAGRQVRIEVTQAERGVLVAEQGLVVATAGRQIADDAARLTRVKFVNGNGTSFDMVDTQRRAREAEIDVTIKEFALLRARIIAFLALASCDI